MKQPVRQLASGLAYAVISVVLVVGSLALALAEQNGPQGISTLLTLTATPNPTQTRSPSATPSGAATQRPTESSTATMTGVPTVTSTVTALPTGTTTPVATLFVATVHVQLPPSSTAPRRCGPFPGWIKGYVVQPGDTLFHIALSYGTTVARLEYGNCKSSTIIFPGERLWVPNVATITPGITTIPAFDTLTPFESETMSATEEVVTSTSQPTESVPVDP